MKAFLFFLGILFIADSMPAAPEAVACETDRQTAIVQYLLKKKFVAEEQPVAETCTNAQLLIDHVGISILERRNVPVFDNPWPDGLRPAQTIEMPQERNWLIEGITEPIKDFGGTQVVLGFRPFPFKKWFAVTLGEKDRSKLFDANRDYPTKYGLIHQDKLIWSMEGQYSGLELHPRNDPGVCTPIPCKGPMCTTPAIACTADLNSDGNSELLKWHQDYGVKVWKMGSKGPESIMSSSAPFRLIAREGKPALLEERECPYRNKKACGGGVIGCEPPGMVTFTKDHQIVFELISPKDAETEIAPDTCEFEPPYRWVYRGFKWIAQYPAKKFTGLCSNEGLRSFRSVAKSLYDKKEYDYAYSLVRKRLQFCEKVFDVESNMWLLSDYALYAKKAGHEYGCHDALDRASSWDKFYESESRAARALRFNVKKCGAAAIVQSEPTELLLKPNKPKGAETCDIQLNFVRDGEVEGDMIANLVGQESYDGGWVTWVGDLNGDKIHDFIRYEGMCGNHGDCIYGVYAGCGNQRFKKVWGEYTQELKVTEPLRSFGNSKWRYIENRWRAQRCTGMRVMAMDPVKGEYVRTDHNELQYEGSLPRDCNYNVIDNHPDEYAPWVH